MGEPPTYNEIYPSAPPIEKIQQNPQQWNQPVYQQSIVQPPRPNVIVINQQVIFGENPIAMTCPGCHQQILTKIEHETNIINHSVALALCLFGLCCFVCVPYCIDSIKDVTHKCSKCGLFLGAYRRGRV